MAKSLEKKDAVNLMIWLQFLMLSTAQRIKNEWMRMELRWDDKHQASTPLSFSPVTQRDVSELMGITAKQTCVCMPMDVTITRTEGRELPAIQELNGQSRSYNIGSVALFSHW